MISRDLTLFATLGIYLIFVLAAGFVGLRKRKSKDIADYFHGGRSFGSFATIMTFWASLFSAFTFVGLPGFFYTHGVGTWGFLVFGNMMMALMIFVVGRKVWELSKEYNAISPVEVLAKRYDSHTVTALTVLIAFVFMLPILSVQIAGVGKLISGVTDGTISFTTAAGCTILIIYIYSGLGGMRTIVWTDALQGTLMFVLFFIIALAFLFENWGGSFTALFRDIVRQGKGELLTIPGPLNLFTHVMLFSFFILFLAAPIVYPYMTQRFFIFRDTAVIKRLAIAFPVLVFLIVIPAAIIGLGAASLFPLLESGDLALSEVLKTFSNPLITALAVTGIVAAAMSTADSQLLAVGSILARDVYVRFINKEASQQAEFWWSRAFILLAAILAFVISINPPALIVQFGLLSIAGFAQLIPAYIAGLFWKSATKEGAIASLVMGTTAFFVFQFSVQPLFGLHPGVLGMMVGAVAVILVSSMTPKRTLLL